MISPGLATSCISSGLSSLALPESEAADQLHDDLGSRHTARSQIGNDCSSFRISRAWDDFLTNMWRRYRCRG